ncbi:EST1-DNA-bind domain-containing protein [Fusarium keratoplasticum]|uniref:EST1-DNA-bind domain-containing protein n=1 Tax=Fusarium keratoplasticum TaxID=1328300 RepID=A0ACC0QQN0_9HYPO|nr:EST1-DNA-bind domain-containing protein [Fusarium keratoplasticum]KAI8663476.1 EST1-DNA-bind domain-containing protein [Fusarium keratoplasticum]
MDKITDKWQDYLKERFPQGEGGKPTIFKCPECGAELEDAEAWRQHIASYHQHQQSQSAKKINAFNQSAQASIETDADRDNRKGHVGETSVPNNIAKSDDTRGAKHQSPPPITSSHALASPSNNRSQAHNDSDQERPHQNTSKRRLRTPDDDPRSKTPSNEAQDTSRQTQGATAAHQSSPQPRPDEDNTSVMIPQPETRPISQDQLVAEVKGIYAGLVMVETKCIEVDNAQSSNTKSKLNNDQWQALIALHRTLLHEHHDFFLASQHPSASPALRRLASKYAMPARMWRHGIHSFLELLRCRLPASLEHMLSFLYLAYSIVALLYETVPAFEDTWIECLGDLGRYRMAIEDNCIRDRETWTGVSRHWYSKASDKSPTTGRLYHHLAILARPNALQQLSYYTKSLCVLIPFPSARESIMTLFDPVLSKNPNRLAPIDAAFVRTHGILFSGKSKERLPESMDEFVGQLDSYIGRVTKRWLEAGYYIGISMGCSLLGYGAESNVLMRAMSQKPEDNDVAMDGSSIVEANPDEPFKQALDFAVRIIETVMRRWGDPNTLPFLHTVLVFMNHMTRFPGAISYLEGAFPWKLTALMLNSLLVSCEAGYEVHSDFRRPERELPRPLPEDFAMRGLIYSEDYFPSDWFKNNKIDEDEKYFELGSMVEERKDRILTLGCKIAASGSWLIWKPETRQFSVPAKYDVELEDVLV